MWWNIKVGDCREYSFRKVEFCAYQVFVKIPPRVKHMTTRKSTIRVGEGSSRREPQPEYDNLLFITLGRETWYRER